MARIEQVGVLQVATKYRGVLKYVVAVAVILLAAGLRVWPLGALELRIP